MKKVSLIPSWSLGTSGRLKALLFLLAFELAHAVLT